MTRQVTRYLLWFANEHADFRINEIKSIISLLSINVKIKNCTKDDPFMIVESDSEESICKIAQRSVTLRCACELWAQSETKENFHSILKSFPPEFFEKYQNNSFKIKVEVFGSSQTQAEKVERIETFSYLPLEGPVKLKNPDISFQYIEYYGLETNYRREHPLYFFFGKIVATGQRDLITRLSLKKRKFIGNTSMDPQLSLIMANQALIKNGDIVLDPFVGTGSLLVAAAQFGAYVLGTDIDYLMLHGKTRPTRKQDRHNPRKNESVLTNMIQYGLRSRYLDVIVADSSLPLWRPNLILDAIITDPPYGIREAMERVGCSREDKSVDPEHLRNHIPSKIQYSLGQLTADLLNFSARHLKIGGRVVLWIPIIRCEYDENKLPHHECLELVGNSEQVLSITSSRRLLTYQKIKDPEMDCKTIVAEEESFREKYQKYVEELRHLRNEKFKRDQEKNPNKT